MTDTTRFAGRTVIVTGAGSGIGHATATRLANEGARVIAADISDERLTALKTELGDSVVTVAGDLGNQAVVDEVVAAADGKIDALANVAGIMDGFVPTAELTDELWERILAVNLTAPMRLTRAVLPAMIAAGHGAIVNVSSEAGSRASAAGTAYTTSKHALNGFTRSTSFFYAPKGVRVNAVAPGATATNVDGAFHSEYAASRLGPLFQTNVPSVAQPEQLAASICWLLSDDASDISGEVLHVDGGWVAY